MRGMKEKCIMGSPQTAYLIKPKYKCYQKYFLKPDIITIEGVCA